MAATAFSDTVSLQQSQIALVLEKAGPVHIKAWNLSGQTALSFSAKLTPGLHHLEIGQPNTSILLFRIQTPSGTQTFKGKPGLAKTTVTLARFSAPMCAIPGGTYMLGSPTTEVDRFEDELLHEVILSPYLIDQFEVSAEYLRQLRHGRSGWMKGSSPATGVTWYEAILLCNIRSKLEDLDTAYTYESITNSAEGPILAGVTWIRSAPGYRLPTEAEWENSSRGTAATPWPWGIQGSEASQYAWFRTNSSGQPHPPGQLSPTSHGLYDMAGNVWEWNWDWYGGYEVQGEPDPEGRTTGTFRCLRGGSFDDSLPFLRCAYRNGAQPTYRSRTIGFRCARNATPESGNSSESEPNTPKISIQQAP